MNKIVTPLSFLKVDGKLEAGFPRLLTKPTHEETLGAICYEEIVVWPPEDSKVVAAARTNLKSRIRLL
jgi:hypothetical protein